MKSTKRVVLELEEQRIAKRLTKSEVCHKAGVQNSIYSYLLSRAYAGKPLNETHISKIRTAIEELPDRSTEQEKETA